MYGKIGLERIKKIVRYAKELNAKVAFENEDKELNMSLYDFVNEQYRKANPIMVCHFTKEEYKVMLEQIKRGRLNERSQRIVQEELGDDKFRYILAFNRVCNNICIAN